MIDIVIFFELKYKIDKFTIYRHYINSKRRSFKMMSAFCGLVVDLVITMVMGILVFSLFLFLSRDMVFMRSEIFKGSGFLCKFMYWFLWLVVLLVGLSLWVLYNLLFGLIVWAFINGIF